jgi:ectoine hydroxylase-related dioxygenase (phytanoyl-CoA dioxygenase family)
VWTRLSEAPTDSSFLAVIPGSHLIEFDETAKRQCKTYPDVLEERMRTQQCEWHLFDGELARPGVLIILSLRLAHGATPNLDKTMRFSWDARFRIPVVDDREIVYGFAPPPHWVTCHKWERRCSRDHQEHMKKYVVQMLLVRLFF